MVSNNENKQKNYQELTLRFSAAQAGKRTQKNEEETTNYCPKSRLLTWILAAHMRNPSKKVTKNKKSSDVGGIFK